MPAAAISQTNTGHVITILNRCIETCTDGEKGYAYAAADVRDPTLKALFLDRVKQRAGFVAALQEAVTRLGGFPENEGTVTGTFRRGWMGVRLGLEGRADFIVLEECDRGEMASLKIYEEALTGPHLTGPVRTLVLEQQRAVLKAKDDLQQRLMASHA